MRVLESWRSSEASSAGELRPATRERIHDQGDIAGIALHLLWTFLLPLYHLSAEKTACPRSKDVGEHRFGKGKISHGMNQTAPRVGNL